MENNKRLTPEDFRYMESKVLEWNTLFGNSLDNKKLIEVYDGLVKEEFNEIIKAVEEDNEPELIDGLCDLMYVAGFRWRLEDTEMDEYFLEYVSKEDDSVEEILVVLDNLVNKGMYNYNGYSLQILVVTLISEYSKKYNILEAFKRVSESNFSKAISKKDVDSGEIILDTCIGSVENGGRYGEVYCDPCGDYFIIKAKVDKEENKTYPTGKVCKGDWFNSVEDLGGLEEFIY